MTNDADRTFAEARAPGSRRRPWLLPLAAAACILAGGPGGAQERVYPADQVKAAFLYHFGTYVEWGETPGAATDPITIALLGADAVAEELAAYLPGRMIQGRPARFRELRSIEGLRDDEILFIGASENDRLEEHLAAVAGRPVLVVTDTPAGLVPGAIVNFRLVDRQVRFEVSLQAARAAGLMLSSRLLSAAMRVETARWPDAPHPRLRPRPGEPPAGLASVRRGGCRAAT